MKLKTRKGEELMDTDEHPREVTLESLQKLPPVFKKNGLVTAGSASVSALLVRYGLHFDQQLTGEVRRPLVSRSVH